MLTRKPDKHTGLMTFAPIAGNYLCQGTADKFDLTGVLPVTVSLLQGMASALHHPGVVLGIAWSQASVTSLLSLIRFLQTWQAQTERGKKSCGIFLSFLAISSTYTSCCPRLSLRAFICNQSNNPGCPSELVFTLNLSFQSTKIYTSPPPN